MYTLQSFKGWFYSLEFTWPSNFWNIPRFVSQLLNSSLIHNHAFDLSWKIIWTSFEKWSSQSWTSRTDSAALMPQVINSPGADTYKHAFRLPNKSNFKKPDVLAEGWHMPGLKNKHYIWEHLRYWIASYDPNLNYREGTIPAPRVSMHHVKIITTQWYITV